MKVEVFDDPEGNNFLLAADFDTLPRIDEYLSLNVGGYFAYYHVEEVWHRQEPTGGFCACLRVALKD